MTPKPTTPHASEILQNFWEDSLQPADLMRRSVEMTKLSTQLIATSQDGQVAAGRLLNHGQGTLAEVISSSWGQYFINVGRVGAQVAQAAACLEAWATTLGAMLAQMAGVVGWVEYVARVTLPQCEVTNRQGQGCYERVEDEADHVGAPALPTWLDRHSQGWQLP